MLNDFDTFLRVCLMNIQQFGRRGAGAHLTEGMFEAGDIFCPGCGGERRLRITTPARAVHLVTGLELTHDDLVAAFVPMLLTGTCLQDGTGFTFVLFHGPTGAELAVFPGKRGGLATPHTPSGVAYYLDQAQRAQCSAANSAAIAMYRAALEWLLWEQGFTEGMLGRKIERLRTAITEGTGPTWAAGLDDAYLTVIQRLGNAVVHPGDGDIAKQEHADRGLLVLLEITFGELLQVVYERAHEQARRLQLLRASLDAIS
jgi:hypothetical protein